MRNLIARAGDAQRQRGFFGIAIRIVSNLILVHVIMNLFFKPKENISDSAVAKNSLSENEKYDLYFHISLNEKVLQYQPSTAFPHKYVPEVFGFLVIKSLQQLLRENELVLFLPNRTYSYNFFKKDENYHVKLLLKKFFHEGPNLFEEFKNHCVTNSASFLTVSLVPHARYLYRNEWDPKSSVVTSDDEYIIQNIYSLVDFMIPLTEKVEVANLLGFNEMDKDHDNVIKQKKPLCINSEISHIDPLAQTYRRHFRNRLDVGLLYLPETIPYSKLSGKDPSGAEVSSSGILFKPVLMLSPFWMIEKNYISFEEKDLNINDSLDIEIHINTISRTHWFWIEQANLVFQQQKNEHAKSKTHELFMLKRVLLTNHPIFLVASFLLILTHSVFSFFAFKNDIQYWRNTDSMKGLSVWSVITSFICEIIIGLYLLDSGETSWVILVEIAIGIGLSFWKVSKSIKILWSPAWPFITLQDAKGYELSDTKKHDEVAIKYMSIALLPCVVGYAVYSLLHFKYRSWYSYFISVLAGTVYTFGFIMMSPQLYINYKLKSVEHLPWRALIYKSLNTFVDDVAGFLIDMPWMHRLSFLRDDIIFFCYLYQRWIYKVDKNRTSQVQIDNKGNGSQNESNDTSEEKRHDAPDLTSPEVSETPSNIVRDVPHEKQL